MHLIRLRRTSDQWSASIRGGLKTDSKCSNTKFMLGNTPFEWVFALPLDVIYYF